MSTKLNFYRTAESVSPKHPDKVCDQISDAILDAHLREDPLARVAIDVAGGHGHVFVSGEVTSAAKHVDMEAIVHRLTSPSMKVYLHVVTQSPEIAQGVDADGAGDQGIMIGYATNETPEMVPLEVVLSRQLNQYIFTKWPFDGKTQITLLDDVIVSVVASFQHSVGAELREVVKEWLKGHEVSENVILYINPSGGDWDQGGFDADTGLTGRKLIVDSYGPRISIGGGAFSGKDPSKVDRSAAYMARKIAVDYLKAREGTKEVFVRLAYAIGVAEPLEASVIIDGVHEPVVGYDLTPRGIITHLDLRRPIYEETARYGHFGRGFSWD